MNWTRKFYVKQAEWSGAYWGDIEERHRLRASWVRSLVGNPPRTILELGAGGGQDAIALAESGYSLVAVEQEPRLARHIRSLLARHPTARVEVIEEDFYRAALPRGAFDAVCYWDGFGIGTDEEQRVLLSRISLWLRSEGMALIDVYTPWHAAKSSGHGWRVGKARREYRFDGDACRWIDRWSLLDGSDAVEQSLRCYSPADLRLLLEGTGLELVRTKPGGMMDYESGRYVAEAPLEQAMWYTAILCKPAARCAARRKAA